MSLLRKQHPVIPVVSDIAGAAPGMRTISLGLLSGDRPLCRVAIRDIELPAWCELDRNLPVIEAVFTEREYLHELTFPSHSRLYNPDVGGSEVLTSAMRRLIGTEALEQLSMGNGITKIVLTPDIQRRWGRLAHAQLGQLQALGLTPASADNPQALLQRSR